MRPILILLFFLGFFCHSQTQALLDIVDSDLAVKEKQYKLDSLLKVGERTLSPANLADLYHNLGSKWYYKNWLDDNTKESIVKAIFHTDKAAKLKKKLDTIETGSLDQTLYNLAYFYSLNDNIFQAIDINLELVGLGINGDFYLKAGTELGFLYSFIGDFYKALDRFGEMMYFYENKGKLNRKELLELADLNLFTAETHAEMGYKEFSREIKINLIRADSILNTIDEVPLVYRNSIDQIEGNRLAVNGNHLEAVRHFQKVLADSTVLDSGNLSIVYNALGLSQIELQDYNNALVNLNKSISHDANYSAPYNNLGDLYLAQKEFEKGLFSYQKAMVYAIDKNREVNFDELLTTEDLELATEKIKLLNHIVTKANGWLKYHHYDNNKEHLTHALETFALADQLVDIIRSESTEYQSKLFWREKGASLYMKAVEVCHLLNKPDQAFHFMERNKALLLLEDISSEQAKEISKLPNTMAEREFELKRAIFLSENEFKNFDTASFDSLASVKQEVYKNKQNYTAFVDSLAKAFPAYADIKKKVDVLLYPNFKTKFISDDEVVLQYILNDEQGYGLLTADDYTEFFKLDAIENLNERIISLYGQLIDMATDRDKLAAYNTLSHQIFKQLIPGKVHQKIKDKKLTLITDYSIQQIPFEAFVVNENSDTYLIEETEIRYAYSMSYLDAKRQVTNHPEKELLGIAPVQFARLGLPELLFSGAEVGEAEKIFSGIVALNGEATKAKFLENIDDSRIVHLSTHADIGEGIDPWIAFSDEKMFLNEIYATKNQADMVVLSACNTSLGELKKGEGAMSLARGFFHSGAKSVVSSLWSTNDKSSKDLMTAFYEGLDEGLTKSAAMRKAKLAYITRYRNSLSPSYWAALIVIGDNSPIQTSGSLELYWVLALAGIILLAIVLYYRFKKNRSILIQP